MKKTILMMIILGLAISAHSQTVVIPTLKQRAEQVVSLLNNPKDFEQVFTKRFLAAVKPEQIVQVVKKFTADYGKPVRLERFEKKSKSLAIIGVLYEKGSLLVFNLGVDPKDANRVTGFRLVSVEKIGATLETVIDELKKLSGKTSFLAAKLNGSDFQSQASHNVDEHLAIGSTFKLYILSELVRQISLGKRKWSDVVTLEHFSLPSGQMQNFEKGSPVTLHTLASMMISISDNTATDQLLRTLGRENVEAILPIAGNTKPELTTPFLATAEMFMLKGLEKYRYAKAYIASDVNGKRKILANDIAKFGVNDIPLDGFLAKPTYISEIEWFASATDLTRLMNWLRINSAKVYGNKARGVMTINKGLTKVITEKWNYVGFKGGSEPGVISLTFLLQSKKGEWFVVTSSWNDKNAKVNESKFVLLIQSAVDVLQKQTE